MKNKSDQLTYNLVRAITRYTAFKKYGIGLAVVQFMLRAQAVPPADTITTAIQPYAVSISPEYAVKPILSAGDRVPLTSYPWKKFQMIGVPDGLGAYKAEAGQAVLYMNHELGATATSEPVIGEPLYRGAFVSKFLLSADAGVISGEPAYDVIVDTATGLELPPARVDNTTSPFVRFCSGTLAWLDAGFDRPIYLCGEENPAPATFDGKGGVLTAIFDHKLTRCRIWAISSTKIHRCGRIRCRRLS